MHDYGVRITVRSTLMVDKAVRVLGSGCVKAFREEAVEQARGRGDGWAAANRR